MFAECGDMIAVHSVIEKRLGERIAQARKPEVKIDFVVKSNAGSSQNVASTVGTPKTISWFAIMFWLKDEPVYCYHTSGNMARAFGRSATQ